MGLRYFLCSSFILLCLHMRMTGECIRAGKTTVVFLPFQSLLSLTDNGITHQRSFSLDPILLWPLPAFVHIHHNNSPAPSLRQQASSSSLYISVKGEIKFWWKWNIHFHSATDGHLNLIQLLIQHLHCSFSSPNTSLPHSSDPTIPPSFG